MDVYICVCVGGYGCIYIYIKKCIILYVIFFSQGLIYVIDSNDQERMDEAKDELNKMVNYFLLKRSIL